MRIALIVLSTCAHLGADVILIDPGTDDRIDMVTGVTISGTDADGIYDFSFVHGGAFSDFRVRGGPFEFDWTLPGDAEIALEAIRQEVVAFGDVVSPMRTLSVSVPYAAKNSTVEFAHGEVHDPDTNYTDWFARQGAGWSTAEDLLLSNTFAYVRSTPAAVPEPSAFVLLGLAAAGIMVRRRCV